MRAWLHRWRVYLVVAPLVLAVGLGEPVWYAVRESQLPRVVDVASGRVGHGRGFDVQLTGLTVDEAPTEVRLPAHTVLVVARFRGRFADAQRASTTQCASEIENGEELRWRSRRSAFVPPRDGYSCDGLYFDAAGDLARAQPGQWYEFSLEYWVREELATGLRPILTFRPTTSTLVDRELRFAG